MDDRRFDDVIRRLSATPSRRGLVGALAGTALGLVAASEPGAGQKRRRKKKGRRRGGTGSDPDCTPACGEGSCGNDGCGGACGNCADDLICQDGRCIESCVPGCRDKTCGNDGCGASCGTCPSGRTCQDGSCVCAPQCGGKACGNDGCGGSCGSCGSGQTCQGGQCVADPASACAPPEAVEMLNLVNAWRAENRVTPVLVLDEVLIAAAETKSADMARTG